MYLPKTQEDREGMIALQSLSQKVTMEQTISILESILVWSILSYLDGEPFHVPYMGNLRIDYKGEEIIDGEKEAILNISIQPTSLLKRIVGQIEDNKNTDIDSAFIEKILYEIESKLEE